ncbi:hypothetical protein FQN55_001296 [Onygenales sp. PD_40]|nr:hypothetical protein FQN55_001296 [Onygenales sp. PD_40]KAK2801902.1 hypothetical protein FQN51_005051 [Onygenales sp. PD_10]
MELDSYFDLTSDEIEAENIFQAFYAAPAMEPDSALGQAPDDELGTDLERIVTASTTSSDPELVSIQQKFIELDDDSTSPGSPGPWSPVRSNSVSGTSVHDQDSIASGPPSTTTPDFPPLPEIGDTSFFTEFDNSNVYGSSTTKKKEPALGSNILQPPPSRKRPRTTTDAHSPTGLFTPTKSRKPTPSPANRSGPSSGSSASDLRHLLSMPGSDDMSDIEREQQEATRFLESKKEQERLDEEYARSLQQSWDTQAYGENSGSSSYWNEDTAFGLMAPPPGPPPMGYMSMSEKPVGRSTYHTSEPSTLRVNHPRQPSKPPSNNNYIEISSDSELEETISRNNFAYPSRPMRWASDNPQAAPGLSNVFPKTENLGASSSNRYPYSGGMGYSSQPANPNTFPPGSYPNSMYPSNRYAGYDRSLGPSQPQNGYSQPSTSYGFGQEVIDLISKTTSELGSHALGASGLRARIFENINPQTTTDELQKLLENIRPDQDLDANREGTPDALKFTLMEHQKLGLAWMKSMEEGSNRGGILADDMGLGKTIQALALMVARPPTTPERRTNLIIAPVALIQQWKREIERMLKPQHQLKVFILHGEKRVTAWNVLKKHDVVLTTFGTLASELKRKEHAEKMKKENPTTYQNLAPDAIKLPLLGEDSKWYRIIVDEAQCIKNKNTKSALACYSLNATYRWCMSGTPMMNNVSELYSLIRFLRIGPYNNIERFNSAFARPLKSFDDNLQCQAMQQLQVLLKAILLRRTKTSKIDGKRILQLPPRTTEKVHVLFSEDEQALYNALETKTQLQFNKYLRAGTVGRNYSNVLVLLLRLRQACCHPHLMTDFGIDANANLPVEVDLIANAKLLPDNVVTRLKENDDSECPVCIDAVENAIIFFPCGHSTCAECFARISDPSQGLIQGNDGSFAIKCPNCRAQIDPKKITDSVSFNKVFCPNPDGEHGDNEDDEDAAVEAADDDSDTDTDSDSDADSLADFIVDDENKKPTGLSKKSKGQKKDRKGKGKADEKPKKKSLAELKKDAMKNAKAKRKYLRRLSKTWETSAKIDKTLDLLREVEARGEGEKTIIFSQFTSLLDLLEVPIVREGWGYRRYDGSMRPMQRNEAVLEFSDNPDCKIMLVSLKAGNSGLNLVAASQVIIFDPFWNPYIEEQAIDRAHRIGQLRPVMVHRILVKNTVEDRILDLQDKKRRLIEGALDEKASQNMGRLGTRELAYLFVSTAFLPFEFTK